LPDKWASVFQNDTIKIRPDVEERKSDLSDMPKTMSDIDEQEQF